MRHRSEGISTPGVPGGLGGVTLDLVAPRGTSRPGHGEGVPRALAGGAKRGTWDSKVIEVDGAFVGGVIRHELGFRFVAVDPRLADMDQSIWPTLRSAQVAAARFLRSRPQRCASATEAGIEPATNRRPQPGAAGRRAAVAGEHSEA